MDKIKSFQYMMNNSLNVHKESNLVFKNKITSIVKETFDKNANLNKLLVIGAGQLNDLSIPFITQIFDEIVLSDIDIKSTKSAIAKPSKKIIYKEIEYTGIEECGFFDDFDTLQKQKDKKSIDNFIKSKISLMEKHTFLREYKNYFDFVYISPIYTQLVYNQVLYECTKLRVLGHPEHLVTHIEQSMLNEMTGIIDRFNANIINLLRKDGIAFVLSDIFQYDLASPFEKDILKAIDSEEKMDQLHSNYTKTYGMGLGDYGLYSMDELLKSERTQWMIWPLLEDKHFTIKCCIYKKVD